MKYEGKKTREISFPLGGIGTGCIGLGGHGGFVDVEIKNRPNKNTTAEFTHFAIKAEDEHHVLDCRILQGDLEKNYIGCTGRPMYTGYGFGPDRGTMAGFPHFSHLVFDGEFPTATVTLKHPDFPGNVSMTAFNPLIPTNEDDSSIPAAFFEITITNTQEIPLHYTLALSCNNFFSKGHTNHQYRYQDGLHSIYLGNIGDPSDTEYGDMTIATDCPQVSYQEYWFRGKWFDNSSVFWNEFSEYGPLKNRSYPASDDPSAFYSDTDVATLAAHVSLKPGEHKKIRFILSWSNPYRNNTWQITHMGLTEEEIAQRRAKKWKNYYAILFPSSKESAVYGLKHFSRLLEDTQRYCTAMYRSTLPQSVLDAITANVSILKSPTCLRLEDGSFYGFEGVHANEGCCEGTCTHVWSYAYAPAFLFPALERSARTNEYTYSIQENGGMAFRLQLPLGEKPSNHRPAVDGQYGTVLRVYREFLISGDLDWLRSIWDQVKRTVEFAWSEENPDQWDLNQDGIMEGRQHHTLDMELFGANSWLSGMYLSGLLAAAKLADILNDTNARDTYLHIFEEGKKQLNTQLFNGEYFCQHVNLKDPSILKHYSQKYNAYEPDVFTSYWNSERQEIKYQLDEGCLIDQVLGQWHADMLNLGEIFEKDKTESALKSIFRYNYIPDMREHVNPCRIYGMNNEQGTRICSYPQGRHRPFIPIPYAEETMHGFEYQVASHMIKRGLIPEGETCVKAVRDRYDGEKRNPWNEMECGSNYARSMSSYALLLAYSGFRYNQYLGEIGFDPVQSGDYSYFCSLNTGFGTASLTNGIFCLKVEYGNLTVKRLSIQTEGIKKITVCGKEVPFTIEKEWILMHSDLRIQKDQTIQVIYEQ